VSHGYRAVVDVEAQPPDHPATARLFVAVWPPAAVIDELAALPRPVESGVRWIPSGNWHVTLRFLGTCDPRAVLARLDGTGFPSATAVLGPVVRRLGRSNIVVPVTGLEGLAATVLSATDGIGRPPDRPQFDGHVTLARLKGGARSATVGAPVAATFTVDEVALVKSVTRKAGAVYETLARWPTQ
jgi:RNA 2',3'-cyclic 3'-phosphodiesterase